MGTTPRGGGPSLVKTVTVTVRQGIRSLLQYALISPELYQCLSDMGVTDSIKFHQCFDYATQLKEFSDELTNLTQSANFEEAKEQIHKLYGEMTEFCDRLETPFSQWYPIFGKVVEENKNLHEQIREMKIKMQLQERATSPTESMKLLGLQNHGATHSESERRATLTRFGETVTSHFQSGATETQ